MKSLLVILSVVALASCSPAPTLGLINAALNHHSGGLAGVHGGGVHGVNVPGAIVGGATGGVPGAVIGGSLGQKVSLPGAIVGGALAGGPGAIAGGLLANGVRPGGRTDRGFLQKGGVYPVGGGGLFQALGFFSQGLTDVVGNAGSILDDVIHLRIPAVLDDGFNAVISVGRGLGGIINAIIPGLGSLLGNLVVSIGKIFICLLGSPGLSGSIFGRTPGRDNPRDIPYICTPDYGRKWGCSYDGKYDNADSIINYYKVKNAKKQALEFINQYTNGQGVDSLTGSRRVVVERVLIIATIADKGESNWTSEDIATLTINIIIINGAIGDSYQPGLGVKIVDEWITTLKKNNKNKNFPDLSKYRTQIIVALKDDNEDKWGGAFDESKRGGWSKINSGSDDSSDSQNSNDESTSQSDNNQQSNGSQSNDSENSSNNSNGSNESNESDSNENSSKNNKSSSDKNESSRENKSSSNDASESSSKNKSSSNDKKESSSRNKSSSNDASENSSRDKSSSNDEKENSSKNKSSSNDDNENSGKNKSNSNDDNASSSKNESNTDSSDDGGSSEYLREKNASSKSNKASEEKSHTKSSTGSGKSQVNADGSSSSEYNFANNEASNSKKSSESNDARSSDRTYIRKEDGDDF